MAKNDKPKKLNLRESFEDGLKRGIVSQTEYDKMTACLDLQVSLLEGKSPEAKQREKLLSVESDPDIRDMLSRKIAETEEESTKSIEEIKEELEIIGVPIMTIIREGLGKHVSTQKYYLITQLDNKAKEKAEKEKAEAEADTPNGEPILNPETE